MVASKGADMPENLSSICMTESGRHEISRNLEGIASDIARDVEGLSTSTVIVICGATGVGKSSVADKVAQMVDGEIVSADSMQVYRGMDIGTAKVPVSQRGVPYHCLDLVDPGEPYSASLYQNDARNAIEDIVGRGKRAIVCGGTGLYIRAAVDDLRFPSGDQSNNPVRDKYQLLADQHGAEYIHDLLREVDPESAELIHPNNVRRTIRAFEMLAEGKSYARQSSGMKDYVPFLDARFYGLSMETKNLYAAINARVDDMMKDGLLSEVEGLLNRGLGDALTSIQAIGYKEFIDVIEHGASLDDAVESVKRSTRRYSKRQRTWFKRDPRIAWYEVDGGNLYCC